MSPEGEKRGVHDLPLVMPLWPDACRVLGIGRSLAYNLVQRDEFPVRVLKLGNRYKVTRADLIKYLGEQ